jgi:hypothetical protein
MPAGMITHIGLEPRPTTIKGAPSDRSTILITVANLAMYGVLGFEPGTTVRSNPSSREKISDPLDMVIFNKAKKMCSQILASLEGRLKSHPSFTSLLLNNLFRETVFHFYS